MHKAGEIAADAAGIAADAAEIAADAEGVAEDIAEEAAEQPAEETGDGIAEAIHDVSLEERLSDCLQRVAVLEERLNQVSAQSEEASLEAEAAKGQSELATDIALGALAEPEPVSEIVEIEPEPGEPSEPKQGFWEEFLAIR